MKKSSAKKYVYLFGKGMSDGDASMNELLGGKGANLAEMAKLGLPVPAGFTITTECCVDYFANGQKNPSGLNAQIKTALAKVEKAMGINSNTLHREPIQCSRIRHFQTEIKSL